jgi:hypothetical protein
MATADVKEGNPEPPTAGPPAVTLFEQIRDWFREEGAWWLASLVVHMFALCVLALVGVKVSQHIANDAPSFQAAAVEKSAIDPADPTLEHFEVAETPADPSELNTETLTLEPAAQQALEAKYYDDDKQFQEAGGGMPIEADQPALGGMGGFDVKTLGVGPAIRGLGGVGVGVGAGKNMGSGGEGIGFGGRGQGSREAMVGRFGGTRQSERAVAAALNWLYRHQSPDGRWSLDGYRARCKAKDSSCSGTGNAKADSAATAMALLPFLAAGQTHQSKGPYKKCIAAGIYWLTRIQKKDGDLRAGHNMYSHGLAAIALCEAYGMSHDKSVGEAAQRAIHFIEAAQNSSTGGWRYKPHDPGDTSVLGWQLMALKSAQMAGLSVSPRTFEGAQTFLKSVSSGYGELFQYIPEGQPGFKAERGPTPAMSAVGLLCGQYLGVKRDAPAMTNGAAYLMEHTPDKGHRNIYYWYYATQVMHNFAGPQWDTWNRTMRRLLIDTQDKTGCAAGSWDPDKPAVDAWGGQGGRLMVTSLSALTLEIYYRYLPLYKLDTEEDAKPPMLADTSKKNEEPATKGEGQEATPAAEKAAE